jgi:hypothetical protein
MLRQTVSASLTLQTAGNLLNLYTRSYAMTNKQFKAREMIEKLAVFSDSMVIHGSEFNVVRLGGYMNMQIDIYPEEIYVTTGGEEDLLEGWYRYLYQAVSDVAESCDMKLIDDAL